MSHNYEAQIPKKEIRIFNLSSTNSMIVRRIGEDEKVIVKPDQSGKFEVPYNGLIIGYSEKAGE